MAWTWKYKKAQQFAQLQKYPSVIYLVGQLCTNI